MAAWEHPNGSGGGTRFLDVPGITGTPRIRWEARVPPERPHPWNWSFVIAPRPLLLASSRGLVTQWDGGFSVLDPDAGKVRYESPGPTRERAVALAGDVLLVVDADMRLLGRDFGSFDVLWRSEASAWEASHAGGLLVTEYDQRITTHRFTDPAVPPEPLWRLGTERFHRSEGYRKLQVVSSALVAVTTNYHDECALLDGATGEMLPFDRSMPGKFWFGDTAGFIGWERHHGMSRALYGSDLAWRFALHEGDLGARPLALTPGVIVSGGRDDRVHCIDRASGRVRGTFALKTCVESIAAVADGVYTWSAGIDAPPVVSFVDYDGEVRWRLTLPEDQIIAAVPLAHRLYVLTDRGGVYGVAP